MEMMLYVSFAGDKAAQLRMQKAAQKLAAPDAAEHLARHVLSLVT
jgi:UDP-N-acetylglucosamine:LPS N-acetylglucosamine transferase